MFRRQAGVGEGIHFARTENRWPLSSFNLLNESRLGSVEKQTGFSLALIMEAGCTACDQMPTSTVGGGHRDE